jgi:uracil-DNA glycosylase family 4
MVKDEDLAPWEKSPEHALARVIDPDLITPGLGPIVMEYIAKCSAVHSDLNPESIVERILYNDTIVYSKQWEHNARFIPGSTFSGRVGPDRRYRVMVIGKIASYEHVQRIEDAEESEGKELGLDKLDEQPATQTIDMLMGVGKDILLGAFKEAGIKGQDIADFYVTNIVRFPRIDNGMKKQIPVSWIKECAHFLQQELRLVQPEIILCLGSEASKAMTKLSVSKAQGRVFEISITEAQTAKVVCVYDPKAVLEKFENRPLLMAGVQLFAQVVRGEETNTNKTRNFWYVDQEEQLEIVVDELVKSGVDEFAVDCEWGGGQHYLDPQAKLRTVQIGWSGQDALVAILHRQGMKEAFHPYLTSAVTHIRRLLCRPGVKVVGHNLAADFGWLYEYGVDLSGQFHFDTMLASHLFEPTAAHDLDTLAVKIIAGWGRHDAAVTEWIAGHKALVQRETMAFGNIPDDILHPYGANDACATWLIYKYYDAKLRLPEHAGLNKLFRELVMPATLAFIEIERNGVYMDKERLIRMEDQYREKYIELLDKFRVLIGKPWFNPNSSNQKVDLLYRELGLEPVKTTGKYPKMWDEVVADGKQKLYSPAVDDETLGMLAGRSPIAKALQDICLISTVRKSFLTPQVLNKTTGKVEYKKGLIGFLKRDGRLHTQLSQMVKTGRLASHDPNLANMPHQQEAAMQKAGGGGICELRSAFMAEPGSLLICADYTQNELVTLAYLSGDPTLIHAVETGEDLHSAVTKEMFQLDCSIKETKKKFPALRIAGKSLNFGVIYGRRSAAISREIEKAGVPCSQEDAQNFVDRFFAKMPLVKSWIDKIQDEVKKRGYVETLWGRKEYFYAVEGDRGDILARQKRQGPNFAIQSFCADLLRLALINLREYRRQHDMKFKLILTVYDSIMLEAPVAEVPKIVLEALPLCMCENAKAPGLGFSIGCDIDVTQRWDEKMYLEDMVELGLPEDFSRKFCAMDDEGKPKRRAA